MFELWYQRGTEEPAKTSDVSFTDLPEGEIAIQVNIMNMLAAELFREGTCKTPVIYFYKKREN